VKTIRGSGNAIFEVACESF